MNSALQVSRHKWPLLLPARRRASCDLSPIAARVAVRAGSVSHSFGRNASQTRFDLAALRRATLSMVMREQDANNATREDAVRRVAARHKIAHGTLANFLRDRIKTIDADVRDSILAAVIADMTVQIGHLEHERARFEHMAVPPLDHDLSVLDAALSAARRAISRIRNPHDTRVGNVHHHFETAQRSTPPT